MQYYCKIVKPFVKLFGVSSNERPGRRLGCSSSVFVRRRLLLILSPSRGNLKGLLHGVYPEQNNEILPLRLIQGQNGKKRRVRNDTT